MSPEHLRNCIAAARRKDHNETQPEAGRKDPAVEDGGWLDMSRNTPFAMRETTGKFAFQSCCWREARLTVHHLTQVHRTSEPLLLDALTDLRAGDPSTAAIEELRAATSRPLPPRDGVEPTTLYPKKRSVAVENAQKLGQLDASTAQTYEANDTVEKHEQAPSWVEEKDLLGDKFFLEDCQAGQAIELRLGAQVMLLRNETSNADGHEQRVPGARRLVNGSRGVIVAYDYACPHRSDDRPADAGVGGGRGGGGSGDGSGGGPSVAQPTCACGNPAAWACPRKRCGNCCGGCERHGSGRGGGSSGRSNDGGGASAALQREADPRAGDDYMEMPPPMPTGPPPATALLSPLWVCVRHPTDPTASAWRHKMSGELRLERPPPVLYPVVRFVGKKPGEPGRTKLIRPEPFERTIYLKGTLVRTQVPLALAWALVRVARPRPAPPLVASTDYR